MIKKDVIDEVHKDLKQNGFVMNRKESAAIFDIVIDNITDSIAKGKTVEISGFGIFSSKLVKRRNLKKGASGFIERWGVYFKCSKLIKEKLNV